MSEIELKFGLPDAAAAAVDAALRRHGAKAAVLTSHYWDTPERHLARAGLALRLRRRGKRGSRRSRRQARRRPSDSKRPCPARANGTTRVRRPELSLHSASKAGALLDGR